MIKNISSFLCILFITININAQGPCDYVNPFIGSANYGATYPGAVAPSGMVSVVPYNSTLAEGNDLNTDTRWHSYSYAKANKFLTGFTHVNLSGVGCPDFGSIILMPTTGEIKPFHGDYGTTYKNEVAYPGYYSADLDKYNIKAEMTATTRTGISKYTFPKGESNILLNLGLGLTNETGASAKIVSDTVIEGYKLLGTFCYNPQAVMPVYFVVKFSKPAKKNGFWKFHQKLTGPRHDWCATSDTYKMYTKYQKELAGDDIGVFFSFDTEEGEEIEVKVGVSYVSIENAYENLEAEQTGFEFDKVKEKTYSDWNKMLSRIKVEGGTKDDKTIFYTALYHILLHPNILQDVNGEYPMMESNKIGRITDGNRYTVFSLWDTYRTVHPFLSLVYPELQIDMVNSMVDMYSESGWLPKWELYSRETNVMEGDPALPVIADTYLRGLTDFPVETAYNAMVKSATLKDNNFLRPDARDYLDLGYVPLRKTHDNSVSHALEYYIADWNLAQLAKALGKMEDYEKFLTQSLKYKMYYDEETGLIRPLMPDGSFYKDFDPMEGENFEPSNGFHEGTSWNYSFYAPHDIPGLIKLNGGEKKFSTKLRKCFDEGMFDMGNEPDINYPYLFNYIKGEEWRTQHYVDQCITNYFTNAPGGIPGNDDTGTMSAWLVYSMMGFYPVCPGNMDYALTTPKFDKVSISLNTDFYPSDNISISKKKSKSNSKFIKSVKVNGKTQDKLFISHDKLVNSKLIEFKTK